MTSSGSFGQSNDFKKVENPENILKLLLEASQKVQTVKSDFEQKKNSSVLANKALSNGKFYYKKPATIKMEYHKPFEYLIVINNGNVIIKDNKNVKQFSSGSSKIFKQINEIIIQSVDGSISRNSNYEVGYQENEKQVLITLTPRKKQMRSFISDIKVYFDKKDYSIHKFVLTEASGDDLSVRFFNKEMNIKISDSEFSEKQ